MKKIRWAVIAFAMVLCSVFAAGETKIPKLEQRVSDFTNTLSFQ